MTVSWYLVRRALDRRSIPHSLRRYYSFFVGVFLALTLVFVSRSEAQQPSTGPSSRSAAAKEQNPLDFYAEQVKKTIYPPGFTRDLSGKQGRLVTSVLGFREVLAEELKKVGFKADSSGGGLLSDSNNQLRYRTSKTLRETEDLIEQQNIEFVVQLQPSHEAAAYALWAAGTGYAIGIEEGSPDRSKVGEASFYVSIQPEYGVTLVSLRRNVIFTVMCLPRWEMAKGPDGRISRRKEQPTAGIPSLCADTARIVDRWLIEAD